MKNKRAVLDGLENLLTGLGVLVILAAVIFLIQAEVGDQVVDLNPCNSSALYNASTGFCCANTTSCSSAAQDAFSAAYLAHGDIVNSTSDIPGWLPIVVITIIGGLLLTLVRFFKKK